MLRVSKGLQRAFLMSLCINICLHAEPFVLKSVKNYRSTQQPPPSRFSTGQKVGFALSFMILHYFLDNLVFKVAYIVDRDLLKSSEAIHPKWASGYDIAWQSRLCMNLATAIIAYEGASVMSDMVYEFNNFSYRAYEITDALREQIFLLTSLYALKHILVTMGNAHEASCRNFLMPHDMLAQIDDQIQKTAQYLATMVDTMQGLLEEDDLDNAHILDAITEDLSTLACVEQMEKNEVLLFFASHTTIRNALKNCYDAWGRIELWNKQKNKNSLAHEGKLFTNSAAYMANIVITQLEDHKKIIDDTLMKYTRGRWFIHILKKMRIV